jgi:EAL domain-containing protein (putative c-di-GMP-specific phosphodiesterase class I)/DNA-binding SARP family transcriptional activator
MAVVGRLSIDDADGVAVSRGLPGRRAELVFAYLAVEHRRTVSRDELADALWPDMLPDTWAAALRSVVTEVRHFLEQSGLAAGAVLASGRGGYQLRLPAGVTLDLDDARAALAAAREQLAAGEPAVAAAHAQRAVAVARLPFLPQHDGVWVSRVREELAAMLLEALELQVRANAQAGAPRAAAEAAEHLVRLEPFQEDMHRLRIRVLGEAGDRAGAKAAFEHCRTVFTTELGVQPSPETEATLQAALARVPPASAPEPEGPAAYSVLVVEDHDFQRRAAVRILQGLGIDTVWEAGDGRAALDVIARSGPPDVIVCDLEMPGMDGVEFIRHIAERDLAGAVIVLSAMEAGVLSAVEALAEGFGLRMLGAIPKPPTARRLSELLADYQPDRVVGRSEHRPSLTAVNVVAALEAGRIVARYRPLVNLATGAISGASAMPGWEDPALGWIGPEVIAAVIEGPLVDRFNEHVLGVVCSDAVAFARAGLDIDVTMRLAGHAFADTGLADRFAEIARTSEIEPRRIVCAIGARSLRRDAQGLAALTRLRLKGFGLSVEDFGTGLIGAGALERLPLTSIKLSASLVSGAAADPQRTALVEEALERGRDRGLAVLAAGCDTAADFDLLLQLGCDYAEGAFIAGPIAAADLAPWAAEWTQSTASGPA